MRISAVYARNKSVKHSVRYAPIDPDCGMPTGVYVPKKILPLGPFPDKIKITIEIDD